MDKKNKRPNIILITADSLRPDFLGCYNPEKKLSKNIDKLASQSLFFENAIVPSYPTFYAFPSIMCGIKPFQYGRYLGVPRNKRVKTIAEVLKANGYSTYAFVADNPLLYGENYNYNRGFDYYFDHKYHEISKKKMVLKYKFQRLFEGYLGEKILKLLSFVNYFFETNHSNAKKINKEIKEFIRKKKKEPYFLWIHYMDTHYPYLSGYKHFNLYKNYIRNFKAKMRYKSNSAYFVKKKKINNKEDLKILTSMYEASIKFLDQEVEDLFNWTKKQKDTYLIFTSDHGEALMEHGNFGHHPTIAYNELIKVPLCIYSPKLKPKKIHNTVSLINLANTISKITNTDYDNFTGFNLIETNNIQIDKHFIANNTTKVISGLSPVYREKIFNNKVEIKEKKMLYSIMKNEYKYIFDEKKEQEELYNIKIDLQETDNLLLKNKETTEDFKEILKKMR